MPPRKPTHIKLLAGTFRPDREPRQPVVPSQGRAVAPSWLPAPARTAFRQLVNHLERLRLPSKSFEHVLAAAAINWIDVEQTTAVIASKGTTYETTTTTGALKVLPRPEVAQRNTALRLLRGYLVELGLTPAALGRVDRAALPEPRKGNPFASIDPADEFFTPGRRRRG